MDTQLQLSFLETIQIKFSLHIRSINMLAETVTLQRRGLTLGSGSSRKPSATVTIIAIMAEISPAICICKKSYCFILTRQ